VDAGSRVRRPALARLDPEDARLGARRARAAARRSRSSPSRRPSTNGPPTSWRASSSAIRRARQAPRAATARGAGTLQAALSANQAEYTTLAADADGVVVSVSAEPGQVLAAGQPVLRLAHDGEKEIVVSVPESQVARLQAGQAVLAFLWADPGNRFPGRIRGSRAAPMR
jgi:multidrug resistance efflux pump